MKSLTVQKLISTITKKMLASWKGLATVIEKASPVDYRVHYVDNAKKWIERREDDPESIVSFRVQTMVLGLEIL